MLNKAIQSGKEKRAPYRGAKKIDSTCRNHGRCTYCQMNREYSHQKALISANQKLQEYYLKN